MTCPVAPFDPLEPTYRSASRQIGGVTGAGIGPMELAIVQNSASVKPSVLRR
jgi:hypothetical protein